LCTPLDFGTFPVPFVAPFVPVVSFADPVLADPQDTIKPETKANSTIFILSRFFMILKF